MQILKRQSGSSALDDRKFHVDISGRGDYVNYLPTNKLQIDVDTSLVLSNGTVKEYFKDRLVSPMIWEYSESDVLKGDLAIMDLLASNDWKRPLYISTTVPSSQYKGLEKYLHSGRNDIQDRSCEDQLKTNLENMV